jgi:hypothetical protein
VAIGDVIEQVPHEEDAVAAFAGLPVCSGGLIGGFEEAACGLSGVDGGEDEGIVVAAGGEPEGLLGLAAVGVSDDIGAGFVYGEL